MLMGGIRQSIAHVARHPDRLLIHGRRLLLGDAAGLSNRYGPSNRNADIAWVADVTRLTQTAVATTFDEVDDPWFCSDLARRYREVRPEWAETFDLGRFRCVYALVRLLAPERVVETGVHDGLSSTLILKALAANRRGRLVSIDRPSSDLPVGVAGPGWLIPQELRDRWTLRLGDAVRLLPQVAAQNAPIDLFLHDSDHSVSHRRFEFSTVKTFLAPAGIMLCDDDAPADGLLRHLAASWRMRYVQPAGDEVGLGALSTF
jgi:predicted O-methyltransferase YrrM